MLVLIIGTSALSPRAPARLEYQTDAGPEFHPSSGPGTQGKASSFLDSLPNVTVQHPTKPERYGYYKVIEYSLEVKSQTDIRPYPSTTSSNSMCFVTGVDEVGRRKEIFILAKSLLTLA